MSVRVVFVNRSGFDAGIGVFKAWEEHGSCLNIFQMTNRGWISENFTNYGAKNLLGKNLQELRGKILIAQDYPKKLEFDKSEKEVKSHFEVFEHNEYVESVVDHVLTYSGRKIAIGSQTFTNYEAKDLLHK
ncbi:uncharacterized protein G2W53_021975 [Senna tora]|uniref:Uncharacterized protein n=1 Tax=Senna tora TaxID=362788 RepID=A0A834TMQ2_9FABA|nr:uncharacterized protein G2W53_021975 [Senna tora]